VTVPAGTAAGQYVLHWKWGSYRNCVNVRVLGKSLLTALSVSLSLLCVDVYVMRDVRVCQCVLCDV